MTDDSWIDMDEMGLPLQHQEATTMIVGRTRLAVRISTIMTGVLIWAHRPEVDIEQILLRSCLLPVPLDFDNIILHLQFYYSESAHYFYCSLLTTAPIHTFPYYTSYI